MGHGPLNAAGPRPVPACGYDVNAAFMSLQQHGSGIHAL